MRRENCFVLVLSHGGCEDIWKVPFGARTGASASPKDWAHWGRETVSQTMDNEQIGVNPVRGKRKLHNERHSVNGKLMVAEEKKVDKSKGYPVDRSVARGN